MKYAHSSETRLEELKSRVYRCVCKYCGSPLKLKKIIFSELDEARIEIFCSHCDRIEYGVEPQVYACANILLMNWDSTIIRIWMKVNRLDK